MESDETLVAENDLWVEDPVRHFRIFWAVVTGLLVLNVHVTWEVIWLLSVVGYWGYRRFWITRSSMLNFDSELDEVRKTWLRN